MKSPTPELSRTYPDATAEAWRELLAASLKNNTDVSTVLDKLSRKTLDDITIRPLYTREDINSDVALQDPRRLSAHQIRKDNSADLADGLSGSENGWDIRQTVRETTIDAANKVVLDELTQGCNSIHLSATGTASTAAASTTPLIIKTADDLHALMDGVYLNMVTVSMQPALPDNDLWQWWQDLYQSRNHQPGDGDAITNAGLALNGNLFAPNANAEQANKENFQQIIARTLQSEFTGAQAVSLCAVDMTDWHNQGSNNVQDVAIACATGVEYLRLLCDLGLTLAEANRQIVFHLSVDADYFNNIAKLRALRATWHHVLTQCGSTADDASALLPVVHAHTSLRMLSTLDADNNQLRNTIACAAAILGGADCISVEAHRPTESAQPFPAIAPSADTRRIARNIQHVLKHESQLHRVQDPLGGSPFIESLTSEMSTNAWTLFQQLESKGTLAVNLGNGMLADLIETNRLKRDDQFATRKRVQVGISEFVTPDTSVQTNRQAQTSTHEQTYGPSLRRDAESFEALRQRTLDTCPTLSIDATNTSKREQCLLLCFGTSSMYRARASFARNLLAVVGLDSKDHVLTLDAGIEPKASEKVIEQLGTSAISLTDHPVVVLCADNDSYSSYANPLATQLKNAGASMVVLAGKNTDITGIDNNPNWDTNLFMGCDIMALAEEVLQTVTSKTKGGQSHG